MPPTIPPNTHWHLLITDPNGGLAAHGILLAYPMKLPDGQQAIACSETLCFTLQTISAGIGNLLQLYAQSQVRPTPIDLRGLRG